MEKNYKITKFTCYLFYILQGTLVNLAPVLFVPLMEEYGLSYIQLGTMVSVNFATQLIVDILLSKMVDKHGYRLALQFCFCVGAGSIGQSLCLDADRHDAVFRRRGLFGNYDQSADPCAPG